ncbi:class I SAM-dependent RNA methyltransferase [Dongia deserti]|uniref:class I SAM-dependent RNA methyltransferase n=1 Tax=Dongia deserti TaxID=2268030 RepID=UPI000E65A4E6|nr:class I SAM-dependent RNA methyltransferase [Dongia deserti]
MSRTDSATDDKVELVTTAMGGQGDAIAAWQGKRVFVPNALPGERVRARLRSATGGDLAATAVEILDPSPDRVGPSRETCGGCALQHWAEPAYRIWKIDLVRQALSHRGLGIPARMETVFVPPATRRRAEFAAAKHGGAIRLGFHARGSSDIVDRHECPILVPALRALMTPLRRALGEILNAGQSADILATETLTGIDLLITADEPPNAAGRATLARLAAGSNIARMGWQGQRGSPEPIVLLQPPQVRFGDVLVDLPMPPFLQPSAEGEAALKSAVLSMIGKPKKIAELYAGAGTFTFDLAKIGKVHAVEGSKPALAALEQAANRAQLGHRITTEARDLERAPLTFQELKNVDVVVFDPPRAGAKAQSEMLAKARVKRIVAVSCNPATFARDARALVDGGYDFTAITIVDQFIWSPHIELVAEFRR